MQQGNTNYSDMGQSLLLNSTSDIGENKRQGHVTFPFLEIDRRHWEPTIKGPLRHIYMYYLLIPFCKTVNKHNEKLNHSYL